MNHKKLLKLIKDKKEEKPKYTVRFEKELLKSGRLSKKDLKPLKTVSLLFVTLLRSFQNLLNRDSISV